MDHIRSLPYIVNDISKEKNVISFKIYIKSWSGKDFKGEPNVGEDLSDSTNPL